MRLMSEVLGNDSDLLYLDRMKKSKTAPSVLKIQFINLRAELPEGLIFAFEGDDDKKVYSYWIRQCTTDLVYEPFPCKGKFFVLQLRNILERDLSGLAKDVYFFVDRDFDELQGNSPSERIFMTDHYSIENYLVCEQVVEEVLKNEIHCHAEPAIRRQLLGLFTKVYEEFLDVTKEHNFHLFVACKVGIEATPTGSAVRLAKIEVDSVTACDFPVQDALQAARTPTEQELREYRPSFDSVQPCASRYRGKFAYSFMMKWIQRVCYERNAEASAYFSGIMNSSEAKAAPPTLDSLAAKSRPPSGLREFLVQCAS